jgi:hypothetical protein
MGHSAAPSSDGRKSVNDSSVAVGESSEGCCNGSYGRGGHVSQAAERSDSGKGGKGYDHKLGGRSEGLE